MLIHNEDGKPQQSTVYSWKTGSVNVAGTDADSSILGVAAFANLFTPFAKRRPHRIKVLASGAAYIKINGGDKITLGATAPFEAENLIVNSITISTGGSAVTITVYLQ